MSETKSTNPKDRAATSRLDLTLFPDTAVIYGALGMTEGDCKYAAYNYREAGVDVSTYVAALRRHIAKFYNGEWADPLTRVPHLANAIACIAIIIDGYECGNVNDNRPPHANVSGLLSNIEENVKHLQKLFPNGPDRCTHKQTVLPKLGWERTTEQERPAIPLSEALNGENKVSLCSLPVKFVGDLPPK